MLAQRTRAQPNRGKVGVLVVDMMESDKTHGEIFRSLKSRDRVARGICEVVRVAKGKRMPVFLVGFDSDEIDSDIVKAAGPNPRIFVKSTRDALLNEELREAMAAENVGTLLVCGYGKVQCALETVQGALGGGFAVVTSYKLMLNDWWVSWGQDLKATLFYARNTEFYWTVGGVARRLGRAEPSNHSLSIPGFRENSLPVPVNFSSP